MVPIHSGTLLDTVHPLHSHANHGQMGSCSQVLRCDSDTTLFMVLVLDPQYMLFEGILLVAVSMRASQWWWRVRNEANSVN